ncbi:MAG TPA: N-acetylneuraminate synthase family protein [Acidimicrobiales bacterium]|nr:N-acetylneuraminate synthase family protein [Acidimicrobiales bacterium]
MSASVRLGRRRVASDEPTYFIADIGANHDGSVERALQLIELAALAGADAAKFQNFRAESIVSDVGFRTLGGPLGHQAAWSKPVSEVYADAALPLEWTPQLRAACDAAGIDYMTSPYDPDQIAELGRFVCAWKIGSGDITWTSLIEQLALDDKPILLATGASDATDVERAMTIATRAPAGVVLMQCNTNYSGAPSNIEHVALNVLRTFAATYPEAVLGLSDHTPGHTAVLGAVALGARVVEKHFTDDSRRPGPDHPFSLEPAGWRAMVDEVRALESALGPAVKRVMDNERETVVIQRRAVRAAHDIADGATLGAADLVPLRPCPPGAIPPYRVDELVGRATRRPIARGEHVTLEDLA